MPARILTGILWGFLPLLSAPMSQDALCDYFPMLKPGIWRTCLVGDHFRQDLEFTNQGSNRAHGVLRLRVDGFLFDEISAALFLTNSHSGMDGSAICLELYRDDGKSERGILWSSASVWDMAPGCTAKVQPPRTVTVPGGRAFKDCLVIESKESRKRDGVSGWAFEEHLYAPGYGYIGKRTAWGDHPEGVIPWIWEKRWTRP